MAHRFVGAGQRQQVVELTLVRAPRQVFGIQADGVFLHQRFGIAQQAHIQRIAAAQRQRQAMQGKGQVRRHRV